jgi:hypothetical protein
MDIDESEHSQRVDIVSFMIFPYERKEGQKPERKQYLCQLEFELC